MLSNSPRPPEQYAGSIRTLLVFVRYTLYLPGDSGDTEVPPRCRWRLKMDRILASKWFFYVVIGLVVAYLLMHVELIRGVYSDFRSSFP